MLEIQKWDKINKAFALKEKETREQVALPKEEICKKLKVV